MLSITGKGITCISLDINLNQVSTDNMYPRLSNNCTVGIHNFKVEKLLKMDKLSVLNNRKGQSQFQSQHICAEKNWHSAFIR